MSLLTSTNAGSTSVSYFIENVGGTSNPPPCIKGGLLGAAPGFSDTTVRVGNPTTGMVLTGGGGTYLPLLRGINGGSANTTGGESLVIGASAVSFQNIVLTDSITTINGTLAVPAGGDIFVGDDIQLGGDLTFTNGQTAGASISGYYSVSTAPLNCPNGADTAIPAVAGLTPGWHIVSCSTAPGGQTEQQVSDMVFRNGAGLYTFGGSLRTPAGAGSFGFKVTADRTGLVLSNSSGAAQNGVTVNFTKILNAA
jgi:hypothetical protein